VGKALFQVDKLSILVSDLLDVSRIQEKKLQLSFTAFNIDELIDECIENIHLSSPDYRFIREGSRANLTVTADRQRIEQVIINLLSNAVKYSPGKNKVIIKTIAEKDEVIVSVQDFGVGISSNYLKKIFSRFFRVEEQEGNFTGLGIGLYISKEIIERHKGAIWVESEPNKGSTFYFKIPVSQ
jgi:signal transduction histidine kinase